MNAMQRQAQIEAERRAADRVAARQARRSSPEWEAKRVELAEQQEREIASRAQRRDDDFAAFIDEIAHECTDRMLSRAVDEIELRTREACSDHPDVAEDDVAAEQIDSYLLTLRPSRRSLSIVAAVLRRERGYDGRDVVEFLRTHGAIK